MNEHKTFMQRCIELAYKGIGNVAPNPMVGAVIVYNNQIIGEGYHQKYGYEHAEVNAINSVKTPELLEKSTIYVSLEPCSHFGKTPPCADLIIEKKIPNVVVGSIDSFSAVSGKGIEKLKNAGVNVITDILNDECRWLNKRFFTFHEKKRPYIILKWAQTKDGFIDKIRKKDCVKEPTWINSELSRILVHKWRTEEQAILVGTTTALNDNPALNARQWPGKSPLRLVIDRELKIPKNYKLNDATIETIVFNDITDERKINLEYKKLYFQKNIPQQICSFLFEKNIQSLIIEGGKKTAESFIDSGLWDEARIFTASTSFFEGLKAPRIKGCKVSEQVIENDFLEIIINDSLLPL